MTFEIENMNKGKITDNDNDNNINVNNNFIDFKEKNFLRFDEICFNSSQKNPINNIKIINDESEK